jgi:hypothetical protein
MDIAAVQVEDRNDCRAVCNAAGQTHSSSASICWTWLPASTNNC